MEGGCTGNAHAVFKIFSQWVSWLAVVLDTSHKLFPGRFAYKHELNTIEITTFDGNHLLIGEGEYGQVYGVKPTEKKALSLAI